VALLSGLDLSDDFVSTTGIDSRVLVAVTLSDLDVSEVDALIAEWLSIHELRFALLGIKLPEANVFIVARGHEARVVFEPADRSNVGGVLFELSIVVLDLVPSVEVVDEDRARALACEKMSTMRELNLLAALDLNLLILVERVLEHVHE